MTRSSPRCRRMPVPSQWWWTALVRRATPRPAPMFLRPLWTTQPICRCHNPSVCTTSTTCHRQAMHHWSMTTPTCPATCRNACLGLQLSKACTPTLTASTSPCLWMKHYATCPTILYTYSMPFQISLVSISFSDLCRAPSGLFSDGTTSSVHVAFTVSC